MLRPAELIQLEREYGGLENAAAALPEKQRRSSRPSRRCGRSASAYVLQPRRRRRSRGSIRRYKVELGLDEIDLEQIQTIEDAVAAALRKTDAGAPATQEKKRRRRSKRRPGRSKKDYDGTKVERAVWILDTPHNRRRGTEPERRNEAARKSGLSTYACDLIVKKIRKGTLRKGDRRGRLEIRGELSACGCR